MRRAAQTAIERWHREAITAAIVVSSCLLAAASAPS
jgi:hypothetical protein